MTKKRRKITASETKKKDGLEEKLIENLVVLQKVNTDLAVKFDKLAKEISSLLSLFEITAKNFASQVPSDYEKDKEFLEKIDRLLEQNKLIARGLTLMEDRMKERVYGSHREGEESLPGPRRPLPHF